MVRVTCESTHMSTKNCSNTQLADPYSLMYLSHVETEPHSFVQMHIFAQVLICGRAVCALAQVYTLRIT